ncbi:hypothetical protein HPB49_016911 [Dermacentor silvarum]|uniref:Uncharacterized protein n=1 Tax=Dermacentor silvarum TaxID=543639 RepID=A0ACB8CGD7_DERSI|nr:hypothetical protein HPB49_016911 [Dermacentor silvarum]
MPREYATDGMDIPVEEYDDTSQWISAIQAQKMSNRRRKSESLSLSSPTTSTSNTKPAPPTKKPAVRTRMILKRSHLPRLPTDFFKIVFRPKGGMNLKKFTVIELLQATICGAKVNVADARRDDQARVNPTNNSYTVATPSEQRARQYVAIKNIQLEDETFEVNAYIAPPDESVRGICYNIYSGHSNHEMLQDLQQRNRGKNFEIAGARRLGQTKSVLIIFVNTTRVPESIDLFGGVVRCYYFKPKIEACFNCRRPGHRADVCPQEKQELCYRCGQSHPKKENPDCTPKCIVCKGDHVTGTRRCKFRYGKQRKPATSPAPPKKNDGHVSRSRSPSATRGPGTRSRSRSSSFPPLSRSVSKDRSKQRESLTFEDTDIQLQLDFKFSSRTERSSKFFRR